MRAHARQATDKAKKAKLEEAKSKGIWVCQSHPLQNLPHEFKSQGGKNLCTHFCTRGYYCRRMQNGKCPHAHIAAMSKLTQEERTIVDSWISNTANMAYAPGKAPAKLGKEKA